MKTVGFVYQCYKQDYALYTCLENVRKYYPEAPIYLMCDNGNDYTKVAKHFKCEYIHYNDNVDPHFLADNPSKELLLERYKKYLVRMKAAFEFLNTDYVLRLEDDVRCFGRIWHIPNFDVIGAINVYTLFRSDKTQQYINFVHGIQYYHEEMRRYHFNCGGGALFKTKSFLEYCDVMINNPESLELFYEMDRDNFNSYDVIDGLGMLFFGYTIGRSVNIADYTENFANSRMGKDVKFYHQYKIDYDKEFDINKI